MACRHCVLCFDGQLCDWDKEKGSYCNTEAATQITPGFSCSEPLKVGPQPPNHEAACQAVMHRTIGSR
eukprot:2162751-Prorocentrum_lima.AAC.1